MALIEGRFFHPTSVGKLGKFQDGALCYPNPTVIAIEESMQAFRSRPRRDATFSLGTGHTRAAASPSLIVDNEDDDDLSCVERCLSWAARSLRNALDPRVVHGNVARTLIAHDDHSRDKYFRLDLALSSPLPPLNDTASMAGLVARVETDHDESSMLHARDVLIASSFFFELSQMPSHGRDGRLQCSGFVRCRVKARNILPCLATDTMQRLRFMMGGEDLARCDGRDGVCADCGRFELPVEFSIASLLDPVTISLRIGRNPALSISGFPRTMEWFIVEQGLDDPFSQPRTSTHECSHRRKRKRTDDDCAQTRNRKRR